MNKEYWVCYGKIKKWNKGQLSAKQVKFMARYLTDPAFDIKKLSSSNRAIILKFANTIRGLFMINPYNRVILARFSLYSKTLIAFSLKIYLHDAQNLAIIFILS